jgi:hypothetical protein
MSAGKMIARKFFHGSSHGLNHPNSGNQCTCTERNSRSIVAIQKSGNDSPVIANNLAP